MKSERREKTSLAVLAELVGGSVSGDPSISISGVAPLDTAGSGDITFLANPKYQNQLDQTRASAIIVHPSMAGRASCSLLLVQNPYLAFAKILSFLFDKPKNSKGVMPGSFVHNDAEIGPDVTISPGCVIESGVKIGKGSFLHPNVVLGQNVSVGEDCLFYPNVTVRENCRIGNRVIIQPSAVIGADGFGFAPDGEVYKKVPQTGYVVIEDDVEIGACTCIDRGTLGETRIGRGCKIDNLVQIGHNVHVGDNTLLVSQVGISGSTVIGRHCTFGGQSATVGHIKIGDHVTVAARGGVTKNLDGHQVVAGLPVTSHRDWLKTTTTLSHLPEMRRQLNTLKKEIAELNKKLLEDKE